MHELLERQLRKLGAPSAPAGFDDFVAAVDATYLKFDRDRRRMEGAIELLSEELLARNRQVRENPERLEQLDVERELALAEESRALGPLDAGIARELSTRLQHVTDALALVRSSFGTATVLIGQVTEWASDKDCRDLEVVQQNIRRAIESALKKCGRVAEVVKAMTSLAATGAPGV